jgi:hypothetical protein
MKRYFIFVFVAVASGVYAEVSRKLCGSEAAPAGTGGGAIISCTFGPFVVRVAVK